MYLPTVSQGNYVKKLNCAPLQRKLSKNLIVFFGVCQFFFGFNFGFLESSRILKMATRFTTAIVSCIMIVLLFLSVEAGSRSYLVYMAEYIPMFIVLRAAKYTLRDFLTDLLVKNEKASPDNRLGIFLWVYTSIMFGAKIATSIVYCSLTTCFDYQGVMIQIAIHIPMIALDIIPIANFVIFYHVYARLKDLRQKYGQREINSDQLQTSYKQVAHDFEKFRSNYDAIFIWGFVTESSKWMVIIWKHLNLIKYSTSWWLYGCSYTWASFITIQICVPAVFAEMISVETDAMKMILHGQLLVEKDEVKSSELTRLLSYVEARPLLRKAWRLVPVDLRLPVTMLSICTTYLIVIIQFSHIYD